MQVIVLGARGFIGACVVDVLAADSRFVVTPVSRAGIDLTRFGEVESLGSLGLADSVVVMAAGVTRERAGSREVYSTNVRMAANLAKVLRRGAARHLVCLSTVDVYGRSGLDLPMSEESPVRPCDDYGASKLASERIFDEACRARGVPYVVLRLPGIYGPGDRRENPINAFIRCAIAGKTLRVHGDGSQRRDYVYVRDVGAVVRAAILKRLTGCHNVVTGRSHRILDIVRMIERGCGRPMAVDRVHGGGQIDLIFAPSKIVQALPDFRFTALEEGIRKTYAYYEGLGDFPLRTK